LIYFSADPPEPLPLMVGYWDSLPSASESTMPEEETVKLHAQTGCTLMFMALGYEQRCQSPSDMDHMSYSMHKYRRLLIAFFY